MTLIELRYLKEFEQKGYNGLDSTLRRRFDGAQIFVNVIDPQTPPNVKFDIFMRLNTGGTPLSAQEMRHCISKNGARQFLKHCATMHVFHQATGEAFLRKENVRMADRELALRFFAFSQPDWEAIYKSKESLDDFLLEMTKRIDSLDQKQLDNAARSFERAMTNAWNLFDGDAFRRLPEAGRKGQINRSLFESWAVALSMFDWTVLAPHKENIVSQARARMSRDEEYVSSFTFATTDLKRVHMRMRVAREIIEGAIS
jgi:hypothetical protein